MSLGLEGCVALTVTTRARISGHGELVLFPLAISFDSYVLLEVMKLTWRGVLGCL